MLEQKLLYLIVNGGLPLIFILLFLEAIPFVGTFVPGQFIVILLGVLIATTNIYPLHIVFLLVVIAAFFGDLFAFFAGRKCGEKGLEKYGFKKDSLFYKNSQKFFKRFGFFSIILGRELNVTRAFVPFIAGLSNMKVKTFTIVALFSSLIWASLTLFLGYTFGFLIVEKITFVFEFVILLVIYLVLIAFTFKSYQSFHKKNYSLFKMYPIKNIILMGIFSTFLAYFIFLNIWGYSPILDEYFWYVYFPWFHLIFGFLINPFFISAVYFSTLLILFIKKKIQLFLVLLWSLIITSFLTLIFSFLLKAWIGQRPLISVIFFGVFVFYLSLIVKKNYIKDKNYLHIQLFLVLVLIFMLLTMYSITRNSTLIMISFLYSVVICELILLLAHYRLFVANFFVETNTKKK